MNNYAKALMDIAEKEGIIDEVSYQFDELNEVIKSNKAWIKMMSSPMLTDDQKTAYIDQLGLSNYLSYMLKTLAHTNQMMQIDDIYPAWVRMMREKNNIAHINVYTVNPLSDKQIDALTKRLKPRFKNQTIEIHVKVRENMIGGLRIVYEGQSLDQSIARELDELFMTI